MASSLSCDLTGLPSFILQFVLGCVAFSTLIIKRYREKKEVRRPVLIWIADSSKQAIAMLGAHFCNLLLAQLLPLEDTDHCIIYLLNFLLDSTLGIIIIYVLLKLVKCIVNHFNFTPLKSGEYGVPFRCNYWLAQCGVVLLVMLVMKLVIGPMAVFHFWTKVGHVILPFKNKELRTAVVIFIVPFIVNVMMFWIVDSIIMRSNDDVILYKKNDEKHRHSKEPVKFRRKHQNVYLPLSNGDTQEFDEEGMDSTPTGSMENLTV
ncbi:PREDICTED: store-operated calcium entry regulator STIMATE-like isoform X2 [Amphimedon queenslandica]|nr:PREDICTED: store-operated calcium entry regulator STIMATE-like isoform X2 [Amphimedon queenslandica]|eukprot:XP_003384959.1 PREDICTED: store-operated calcium entry regulator STIMATE-like isoform X2 [Amphimedon queenslandica]